MVRGGRLRFRWLLPDCDTLHPGMEGWGAADALDWSNQVCAVGRVGRSSPEVRPLLLGSALICANLQRSVWAAACRRGVSYTCWRVQRSSCRRGLDVGVIALGDTAGLRAGDAEARMLLCARAFDRESACLIEFLFNLYGCWGMQVKCFLSCFDFFV